MAAGRSVHPLFIRKFPRKVKKARDNLEGEPAASPRPTQPFVIPAHFA
jgi:hypothetical protein